MLPARLLAALAAALLAVALLAPVTEARTVKLRGPSGFSVKAPQGFKLKAKKGIYRITGRGLRLTYARVKAGGRSPADTGAELARAAKTTATSVRSSGSRWSARLGSRRVEVRAKGANLVVLSFGRTARKAGAAQNAGQLALLRRIANTARGGRAAALPGSIPLRPFTAPDGSATASVPDLPGWTYNGGSGVIEGSGPEGSFAFGVPFFGAVPGSFAANSFPVAPFPATAGEGLTNLVPQFFARSGLPGIGIQVTGQFPGSEQILGAGYVSGFLTAAVTAAGAHRLGRLPLRRRDLRHRRRRRVRELPLLRRGQHGHGPAHRRRAAAHVGDLGPEPRPAAPAQPGAQLDPHHQRRRRPDRPGRLRRGGGEVERVFSPVMELPPEVRELFEKANFAHLATLTKDGSPSSTAIWAGLEGDNVVFFTQEGSLKARNMAARSARGDLHHRPRGPVPDRPAARPGDRGPRRRGGATTLADVLAMRYTGEPFPYKPPTSRLYVVEIDKVRSTQLPFEHRPSAA